MHDADTNAADDRRGGASGLAEPRSLRIVTTLPPFDGFDRWLTLDEPRQTNHVLYDVTPLADRHGLTRAIYALDRRRLVNHRHVLELEAAWWDDRAKRLWMSSPYIGHGHGLVTLESVRQAKGGMLPVAEAQRAAEQLLRALHAIHLAGFVTGSISPDSLLVDRSGAVRIEHHALDSVAVSVDVEKRRDEIAGVAAIVYGLLTGRVADETSAPLSRLVRRDGAAWDAWYQRATDPVEGFVSAAEAEHWLPGRGSGAPIIGITSDLRTSGVVERLRSIVTGGGWRR